MNNIIGAGNKLAFVVKHNCQNISEALLDKKIIQESYTFWAGIVPDKSFLNWGLWDKKILQELQELDHNFPTINGVQNLYSLSLIYFLIRPLLKKQLYNKRLVDVGSGNGIGLKVISQLLDTNYALGIDLTNQLVAHSNKNFYLDNHVNYIQSDAEHLPLKSNSIDIITNLESSHNYPIIEHFFSEVERVLVPGGYFCYADVDIPVKSQSRALELFLKKRPNLKIIQKQNISKMVQASIYDRLIFNEDKFYEDSLKRFGQASPTLFYEIMYLANAKGLAFLPWWKIRFKRPELSFIAKAARREKFWGKKYYFYYLVQKIES
jgi:ubiquinone/menaquinone biosynthesis C-methylase UbiE